MLQCVGGGRSPEITVIYFVSCRQTVGLLSHVTVTPIPPRISTTPYLAFAPNGIFIVSTTPYSQGFRFLYRHSRRRLGGPWVGPINAAKTPQACYSPPRGNLNLDSHFYFSLPLPVFGCIFLFLHPRGHNPTALFTYCAMPDRRVKCGGAPVTAVHNKVQQQSARNVRKRLLYLY